MTRPTSELAGDRGGVQRSAAAERHQGEVARVAAPFDGDRADRFGDLGGGDPVDAHRRVGDVDPERPGDLARDGRFGAGAVERHFAAGKPVRIDQPHQQIDIGQGGPVAAEPVTGRARSRTHALRPHLDPADIVDAHDAAAAGADRVHVEHGDREGEHVDLARGRRFRHRAANQAGVERGAADIHGDEVAVAGLSAEPGRPHHGARGSGQHGQRRVAHDDVGRGDAAARLEDIERAGDAAIRQPARQPGDIGPQHRRHIGGEHGGRGSRKLAKLAQDFARQHDVKIGKRGAQALPHPFLVHRVEEREQEAHGDALDPFLGDGGDGAVELRFVDPGDHRAVTVDTARDPQAQAARHQGCGPVLVDPVDQLGRAREPADFEYVPEIPVGDQGGPRALALDHRVGGDRGAVADPVEPFGGDARPVEEAFDGFHHGLGPVVVPIEQLGDRHLSGGILDQDDVGEGAADIDSDAVGGFADPARFRHATTDPPARNLARRLSRLGRQPPASTMA